MAIASVAMPLRQTDFSPMTMPPSPFPLRQWMPPIPVHPTGLPSTSMTQLIAFGSSAIRLMKSSSCQIDIGPTCSVYRITSGSLNQPMYVSASSFRGGRSVHFSPRRIGPNIERLSSALLGYREPAWTRPLETSRRDQFSEERPLDGPAEPLPHLVLVREDRGANPDQHEFREGLLLVRLPRLVPGLVPAQELARVAMSALAVVDRDVARHDRRDALELLTHFPQGRRLEAELGLDVIKL